MSLVEWTIVSEEYSWGACTLEIIGVTALNDLTGSVLKISYSVHGVKRSCGTKQPLEAAAERNVAAPLQIGPTANKSATGTP